LLSRVRLLETPWTAAHQAPPRFPEIFRALSSRGAEVIVVSAAWPQERHDHWRLLMRARAIENQVFLIGVNRIGKSYRGFNFAGHSMVVDPWGEILWEGDAKSPGLSSIELDLGKIPKIRQKITIWKDRCPDLYRKWLQEEPGDNDGK